MPHVSILHPAWLNFVFTQFGKQVKADVKQCFSAVEPRNIYSTYKLLSATKCFTAE